MSSLDQIAKISGYSKATVSRVLNNSPHVNVQTRDKILEIMKQLDYVPNRNAISLAKGQTMQIGIITGIINEMVLPFLNSFVKAAERYGFQSIIYITYGDEKKELQAFEDLRQKRVDAVTIVATLIHPDVIASYLKYGPIVSWQRMNHPKLQWVSMDQYQAYTLAIQHLVSKGYKRIANAFGRSTSLNTQNRMRAYEHWMGHYNLPILKDFYYLDIYNILDGESVMKDLIARKDEGLPEAILCANDYVAAGMLTEARRQGIRVPEDIAIVGFDNTDIAHTLRITTIDNPIQRQGENAFFILSEKLLGESIPLHRLDYELIERETT